MVLSTNKMAYKFETKKLHIKKEDDKRVKLTQREREQIKKLYNEISQRKLAKMFNVSRRLIQFIGDPQQLQENIKRNKERGGYKQYYDKNKRKEYMKTHRKYKQELMLKNKLI